MTTDRALLEAAARAAGLEILFWAQDNYPVVRDGDKRVGWNPLMFDSDALRLAVRLGIHLTNSDTDAWATTLTVTAIEPLLADPHAATRRAIVRAAAAVARKEEDTISKALDTLL